MVQKMIDFKGQARKNKTTLISAIGTTPLLALPASAGAVEDIGTAVTSISTILGGAITLAIGVMGFRFASSVIKKVVSKA